MARRPQNGPSFSSATYAKRKTARKVVARKKTRKPGKRARKKLSLKRRLKNLKEHPSLRLLGKKARSKVKKTIRKLKSGKA